jgi:mannosyltransferase
MKRILVTRRVQALFLFAAVNLVLLAFIGPLSGGDTVIYLDGATRLLDGQPLIERQPSYLGYIVIVAACQAMGVGLLGLILLQIGIATVAAGAVYRLGAELAGARAALIATSVFALDVETNRWHGYVLADSLYMSALTVAVWHVHRASGSPPRWGTVLAAIVSLIVAGLIRPEGWFVVPAAALYWIARAPSAPGRRWVASLALVPACMLLVLVLASRLSGNLDAVDPAALLHQGQTMWDYDGWRVTMPQALPDEVGAGSGERAIRYALAHPLDTAALMAARVVVHLIHVRPFYSTQHNAAIVLWLVPVYTLAVVAVWYRWTHPLTIWCALVFASQALVVALTHADADGRYLAHVMPIVYPFVGAGAAFVAHRQLGEAAALKAGES